MNHASIHSARLQRVLTVLRQGKARGEAISTWDIMERGKVMAVSACISELRALGARIDCQVRIEGTDKARRYYYTLIKEPPQNG